MQFIERELKEVVNGLCVLLLDCAVPVAGAGMRLKKVSCMFHTCTSVFPYTDIYLLSGEVKPKSSALPQHKSTFLNFIKI